MKNKNDSAGHSIPLSNMLKVKQIKKIIGLHKEGYQGNNTLICNIIFLICSF